MTTIILTRHGHVAGIQPERFRGRSELELTPLGVAQAQATAIRIATEWRPDAIYTSPMGRCIATGNAIASVCGVAAQIQEELNDLDYGTWQGRVQEDVRAKDPSRFRAWRETPHLIRFPEGESLQDLIARTANVLRFVLEKHSNRTVVLVGHDSVNKALLLQLLDQPLSAYWRVAQEPCAINLIDFSGLVPTVHRINETYHLEAVKIK